MTWLQIIVAAIAVLAIAGLAWCEDVRSRELNNSAVPGRDEYGHPSAQVGNSAHPMNGFGSDAGACEGVPSPGRASGEVVDHD